MKKNLHSIEEIRRLMKEGLRLRKLPDKDADFIIDDFLESEMEGKPIHGLSKFLLLDSALSERTGKLEIVRDSPIYALVNGQRELGHLGARFCVDLLVKKTKTHGVGMVGLKNVSRYSRLKPYGEQIARNELIGIVMNTAGPPAVAPYGSADPVLGTNPVCFAFPSHQEPVVFDFSTSERTWGEIRQAVLEKCPLPSGAFLDAAGKPTDDPGKAEAVLPFGSAKGSALCLAVEILAGALVGAEAGKNCLSQFECGYLFLGIDPAIFSSKSEFTKKLGELLNSVRSARPRGVEKVLIPGDKSNAELRAARQRGKIEVAEEIYLKLVAMSKEMSSGGIVSTDKLD